MHLRCMLVKTALHTKATKPPTKVEAHFFCSQHKNKSIQSLGSTWAVQCSGVDEPSVSLDLFMNSWPGQQSNSQAQMRSSSQTMEQAQPNAPFQRQLFLTEITFNDVLVGKTANALKQSLRPTWWRSHSFPLPGCFVRRPWSSIQYE